MSCFFYLYAFFLAERQMQMQEMVKSHIKNERAQLSSKKKSKIPRVKLVEKLGNVGDGTILKGFLYDRLIRLSNYINSFNYAKFHYFSASIFVTMIAYNAAFMKVFQHEL